MYSTGHDLSPSQLSAPALDLPRLAKTEDCAECHTDVASHWMHSAHAYASFDNPWYRASVDEFRAHRGEEASRFCAGCHDPLLLLSGDIDQDVKPENDLAYAGVTCLVCHSVESTRPDGNASFTLTDEPVLIPDPAVPEDIEAHRRRLTMQPLRTAALCGSCHRSFSGPSIGNPNHLQGIDDLGDWTSSAFAGAVPDHLTSVEASTCQGCHMSAEAATGGDMAASAEGLVSSHRWAASHTAMTDQLPDPLQREKATEALAGAVVIDVGAVRVGRRRYVLPKESRFRGGEHITFDVLLENTGVGHRFPGGARDMHDVWVEVEVSDGSGELIGVSRATSRNNDEVFVLRATVLDGAAKPETLHRVHRFSSPAFDRTLPPHDTRVVRYTMTLPEHLQLPLRVDARLRHRKHSLQFQDLACEASRTERGIAFALGAEEHAKVALDPCARQPVTEIALATVWMGRGANQPDRAPLGGAARPTVDRLLGQALGLLHAKQEHVHLAKPSLDRALRLATEAGSPVLQARIHLLRARLAATQARTKEAIMAARRAEALVGAHPVIDRVQGDAYARVWRWSDAAEAYSRVVEASPLDHRAWRDLARAHGSLSDDQSALFAAEAGLRLAPRDEDLLRSRALALEGLGHADAEQAKKVWLRHRTPDSAPQLLALCERNDPRCRRDRQPIPHYSLTPPPRKAIHASAKPR